ncbi:MAG: FAD-dependent oxidoreductase, partial [Woeseiaceae bacterium]
MSAEPVDVVVVGGGPAGSTCARELVSAGREVIVLDRATFPRTKLCAGWVTPEALSDLELDPSDYPHRFLTFEKLQLHWKWLGISHASRQHSIRRFEFDDFLLRRSGARVVRHKVRNIRLDGDGFIIDDAFRCRY